MKRIGLTGGIGSGKSTISKLLSLYDIPVYIADIESKRITDESLTIREKINNTFGEDLYPDGRLDKKRLGSFIFSDKQKLQAVNQIIHPEVNKDFQAWAKRQNCAICFLESAILYESGFNQYVDLAVMVYAPLEIRLQRTMSRDKASKEEVMRRIASQMPDEEKKNLADFLIINDDIHPLIPQVEELLSKLIP